MTVSYRHPDYEGMLERWQRCIDVCKGQDAVHSAGARYLPKLKDQSDSDYLAYLKRTPFYNATWRTIVGLQGMLFRKPPQVKTGAAVQPMLKDITMSGTSLHIFALEIAEEALKLGRVGVFVDFPLTSPNATRADVVSKNIRPSMQVYKALSITNWKYEYINNETKLSMVVLQEHKEVPKDEFESECIEQYRVLDLVFDLQLLRHVYRVREIMEVTDPGTGKVKDLVLSTVFPKINGEYMEDIPFCFIGVDDTSWDVDEPPLIDLVDMNLSHYMSTADYEHGCHFTGLPTAVISGYTPTEKDEKFFIGSMSAWVFPSPQAKATYLEFTGQGLNALATNISKKENYMAVIGARMLEAVKGGVESAKTASIHRGGEQSMLSSVAQTISIGITKALNIFSKFAGETEDVSFELNRDFFPIPMDALTLTALIAGWQNGAYSYDTMFANLKKGEIVPVDADPKKEQAEIEANPPPVQQTGTTPGNAEVKGPKAAATPATPAPTITQLQNNK